MKKMYSKYRLQEHRCEILGFSTENPRGENTFAPKCTFINFREEKEMLPELEMDNLAIPLF